MVPSYLCSIAHDIQILGCSTDENTINATKTHNIIHVYITRGGNRDYTWNLTGSYRCVSGIYELHIMRLHTFHKYSRHIYIYTYTTRRDSSLGNLVQGFCKPRPWALCLTFIGRPFLSYDERLGKSVLHAVLRELPAPK